MWIYGLCSIKPSYSGPGVNLSMGYQGTGSGAMVVRQGTIFTANQILSSGGSKIDFEPNTAKIGWFTMYAFTTSQSSTLFGYFSTSSLNYYISLMINNGYLKIESKGFSYSAYDLPTVQSSSASMYKTGWNLVWYADNGSNYFLYGFPNFATPAITYSASNTDYATESYFRSTFGGEYVSSSSIINSFQGIIHTVNIVSSFYSASQAATSFLVPTVNPAYPWDYFIGMFPDLGSELTPHFFKNQMSNYNSQNVIFDNDAGFPLDSVNGMQFSSGNSQSMTNIIVTSQRAIGVQFWFKGSFVSGMHICHIQHKTNSSKFTLL